MRALVVLALLAAPLARADVAVTLESLHKEFQELKAEIRGLRQEIRTSGLAARHRRMGTNDVSRVWQAERPPKDPEARKAWYAERRKIHKTRMKALREKHAEKGAQPVSTGQNNK